ncbi:alpha/beta hydrolase [Campylobacter curvus]|uniref:alpha/beta hydrolase n=1 Tax=Campylobacter curvus TaxID=200 RepID=UPI00147055A0|nr:alpha/beta fold hydrolase [Campylobacter curvus]
MRAILMATAINLMAVNLMSEPLVPLVIKKQGSFFAGGVVKKSEGKFSLDDPLNPAGQTLHGDHAYVSFQVPSHARKFALVYLHGAGQSAKTWESTPDGREGFGMLFLRKGYATYLIDQPRRGRAGRASVKGEISDKTDDQFWLSTFRIGLYDDTFPKGAEAMEQFLRQMTPNTAAYDANIISDAVAASFEKSGEGVLITHSQGGEPGWLSVLKSPKIKGIVSFEPGSGFVFAKGEAPKQIESSSPFGALGANEISMDEFKKLTKIPILIIYGDNIAENFTKEWPKDHWRVRMEMAQKFVAAINKHGGNAKLIHLPKIGIKGNTHFAFADTNSLEVAQVMQKWLDENGFGDDK